jgi:hypothetical protein
MEIIDSRHAVGVGYSLLTSHHRRRSLTNVVSISDANVVRVGCNIISSDQDTISGHQPQGARRKSDTLAKADSYLAQCIQVVGVILAVTSGLLIGSSFVFKKKGLLRSQAGGEMGEGVAYLKSVSPNSRDFKPEK